MEKQEENGTMTDAIDLISKVEMVLDFLTESIKNPGLTAILLQCQEDLGEANRSLAVLQLDSAAETV